MWGVQSPQNLKTSHWFFVVASSLKVAFPTVATLKSLAQIHENKSFFFQVHFHLPSRSLDLLF